MKRLNDEAEGSTRLTFTCKRVWFFREKKWRKKISLSLVQSVQDLDPRPCTDNDPVSILPHEMTVIEPGENPNPTRTLTWKSLDFLRHIKCRTNDDRFPLPLWEAWF
jgi:hypothetical protein